MPLEQIGNAVIFYAFYTNNGSGATGETVTADVWEVIADGTATEIASGQGATEIGDGLYRYRVVGASIDAQAEYIAVFKCAGTVDVAHIPALWVIGKDWTENIDTASSTILADTNELQTDWTNGGRLDLILDAILADTNELQTDWTDGGRLDLLIDAILADTGELQADWTNGGRLDLILDAIKAQTDLIPGLPSTLTAAQVWAYASRTLTQTAAVIAAILEGSVVSVYQYTTWTISLTGLGDISARSKLYFTAKGNLDDDDDDDATILQVEETDGLLYIGGADADDSAMATLVVDNETTGAITVTVDDSVTGLDNQRGLYDVKMITAAGTVSVLTISTFKIVSVVTKAVA